MAVDLAPNVGHILDLVGVTGISANDPALAAMVTNRELDRQGVKRTGTQNIWCLSNLMPGKNDRPIEGFAAAANYVPFVIADYLMIEVLQK